MLSIKFQGKGMVRQLADHCEDASTDKLNKIQPANFQDYRLSKVSSYND